MGDGRKPGCGRVLLMLLGVVLGAGGCGAKTSLKVPDANLEPTQDAAVSDAADGVDGVDGAVPLTPCVTVPFEAENVTLPLQTTAQIGQADVALLMDVSASMGGEITSIRRELRDVIVPGIEEEIPEVRLSVASFSDFPVKPFGDPMRDAPFRQRVSMTSNIADVQGGVDALTLDNGLDHHESQLEALYQLATGEGLDGWIAPSFGCATGGFGYPCFRPNALPVVLLFTDAPMHGGPASDSPYTGLFPVPHTYGEARNVLVDRGIRVIGFFSGPPGDADRRDLEAVARDTGSLGRDGEALVFDIGADGRGLGDDVIDAIKVFADAISFDVDLEVRDADPSDGFEATALIARVVPLEASPASGVASIDREAGVFRQVQSGTRVSFEVELRNDAVAPGEVRQSFDLIGVFRADGREVLGETQFQIVVPGADGDGCPEARENSSP